MTTTYTPPARVRENQQRRALARRLMPCGEGVGHGLVCSKYPAVLYPRGWRCAACAAAAGLVTPNSQEDQT